MIIDTHAHINSFEYDNIDEIIEKLRDYIIINSGINEATNKMVIDIANKHKNFYASIGYHPLNIDEIVDLDLSVLEQQLKNKKVVAIGEIGLDYHYRIDNKDAQKDLFCRQLKLAEKYNLPVIVHSRDAINDTYEILKKFKVKADIHCFSSSYEMAKEFIKLNDFIGIGGTLTFKNNVKTTEIVKKIDLKSILLETDSPYLAPVPLRGKKNDATNLKYVIMKIAELKEFEEEKVISILNDNAVKFFNLKGDINAI